MIHWLRFLGIIAFALIAGFSFVSAEEKCVYLDVPVIAGEVNDPEAVVLVQHFLRTYEHFHIDITGVYDDKTQQAVREFQKRYVIDILAPWGLVEPTKDVSVTTLHKMNDIYCGAGSFLSPQEKEQILLIQKKYSIVRDTETTKAATSATTTFMANITEDQNGRLVGTPIGFISEVSLPILIMLFILMVTQTYFMWGFIGKHPQMQLFPREIK